MISILLADDHPVILRGLRDLFDAHQDLRVVAAETDALEVSAAVELLKPNVLVVDLMMPGASGIEIIRQVSQHSPDTYSVILSMHSNVAYVWEALCNGALGYVLKCVEGEELVRAVREVSAGRRYLSPPLSAGEVEKYAQLVRQRGLDPLDMLTGRERQVLSLAAEGHTSGQIADMLQIGTRTVESHRASLLHKLGLRHQTDLVRYAIQRGLVPPD